MTKTITQTVVFKNTKPEMLYSLYMDEKKHSAAIGAPVKITQKEGAKYSAHGNYITGKTLQLIKNKLIVQSWRSADFKKTDMDSVFILLFAKQGNDALLQMVHANLPEQQYKAIKDGWNVYYWKPWKVFLMKRKKEK
jgi:activator of HSP90 ATPase